MNFEDIRAHKKFKNQYQSNFQNWLPKSQKLLNQQSKNSNLNKPILVSAANKNSHSSTSIKQLNQEQLNNSSYIISISEYKQRKSLDSIDNKSQQQSCSRESYDSQNQKNKRNLIYDSQSFKQTPDDLNQTTIQIFLNKNKNKYNDSISTGTGSFSNIRKFKNYNNKNNEQTQQEYNIKIEDFKIGRKLGAGKFGDVFLARHKNSGFICAIKRINKQKIDEKLIIQLIREIKIQTFLNNPNIVKLYTFFCDKQFIYLVLELCLSGQLYNFLKKKRKLTEALTKNIVQQSLKALDYMHENQIIHRDLKPENIIFHNGMIKLCDFGWSISSKTMRQTFCGTPLYVSPELIKRKNYNNKIDVWSIGILTYQLLLGRVPFDISTERDFIKIIEEQIKFSKATKISDAAKQFILICLKKDPRQRYTVPQLLQHPFIQAQEVVSAVEMS